jgi:hypothetical protein
VTHLTGRQSILIPITSFAVAYVRQGLSTHWAWWNSLGDLFGSWFIHTIALFFFIVIAAAIILRTQEFFVGTKPREDMSNELFFYLTMAVLVGAVSIYVIAHWPPSGDYDD